MTKIIQYILKISAQAVIRKYSPDVIGITGSVGKTSAKEAVRAVLSGYYNVRANIKNYNNEIGVPLTIIGVDSPGKSVLGWVKVFLKVLGLLLISNKNYPNILILEMGADREGDIDYLVNIAPCDIGIVTDVSESHLEFFGSVNKIKREKRKIVEHLKVDNYALLNYDVTNVLEMKDSTKAKVITFGFDKNADISVSDAGINYKNNKPNGISFKLVYKGNIVPVFVPNIMGFSHIYSALVAVGVGSTYGINLIDIAKALGDFTPPKGRMNLIDGIKKSLIIDDTYNSSPASSKAALEVMQDIQMPEKSQKIAVLGDMLELGRSTGEKHREIGFRIAESGIDILITKGEAARDIAAGAIEAGMDPDKVFSFSDNESAGRFLQERIAKGDLILIKGSQGMRMEQVVREVMAEPLRAEELLVRQGREWL